MSVAILLLYDGVCGFCARVTQFVLPLDRHDRFQFAALQSELARDVLARHGESTDKLDTFYLVLDRGTERERVVSRGRAALRMFRELGFPWSLMAIFEILPTALLNVGYNLIARNRYRWFGKLD